MTADITLYCLFCWIVWYLSYVLCKQPDAEAQRKQNITKMLRAARTAYHNELRHIHSWSKL